MSYLEGLPEKTDLWDVVQAREHLWKFTIPTSENIMRGPSPLSLVERELIGCYVSGLNACSYCFDAHSLTARTMGLSEEVTEALLTDPSTAPIDEKLKPIFSFARKLTQEPSKIIRADIQAMADVGWSDDAISSVIAVVSWFNFVNRLVFAHGCELREDVLAMLSVPSDKGREDLYQSYVDTHETE